LALDSTFSFNYKAIFVTLLFGLVVTGLVSVRSQEIGWEERLGNDVGIFHVK